ncbi:MAG: maltokinase N-terminal cap-like domain-containing protein, partial [Acidimicrobiia bacterium]
MISTSDLCALLPQFLARQRWSGARDRNIETVSVVGLDTLRGGWPAFVQAVVEVILSGGETARYHVLIGLRPQGQPCEFLHGSEHAVIGDVSSEQGPGFAYDALLDPDLGLCLLELVAPSEAADRVRHVGAEQSNTSLVYDDRLILKVFRRLAEGPNPEVEVSEALSSVGFVGIPEPVAYWRRGPYDLALCQRFLSGGSEGWSLALSSLRDVYAAGCEPSQAGGDFAAEAERLGRTTAELHVAMARAFGASPGDDASWARDISRRITGVLSGSSADAALSILERLPKVSDPGPSLRVHGDYHLGQVMR